jgi:hypothetical protein
MADLGQNGEKLGERGIIMGNVNIDESQKAITYVDVPQIRSKVGRNTCLIRLLTCTMPKTLLFEATHRHDINPFSSTPPDSSQKMEPLATHRGRTHLDSENIP